MKRNGEPVPHPQHGVPLLEGVPQGDQARVVVEEPSEAVVMIEAVFEDLRIFVHTPGTNGIWRCTSKAKMKKPKKRLFH